ncbi:MAG: hypothetical protein WD178_00390 [Actinomycetota bacterium]
MASVHIHEIQKWLASRGRADALPGGAGMFVEIRFDVDGPLPKSIDQEFAGRSLTVDSPQGTVTITFDEVGQLRSLDIS